MKQIYCSGSKMYKGSRRHREGNQTGKITINAPLKIKEMLTELMERD